MIDRPLIDSLKSQIPAFEDRFSESPKSVPVSGRPTQPPIEQAPKRPYPDASERITTRPVLVAPSVPTYRKSKAGRPPASTPCLDGEHQWKSWSRAQAKCAKCKRKAMKIHLPPGSHIETLVKHVDLKPAHPDLIPDCDLPAGHSWRAYGKSKGHKAIRCTGCGRLALQEVPGVDVPARHPRRRQCDPIKDCPDSRGHKFSSIGKAKTGQDRMRCRRPRCGCSLTFSAWKAWSERQDERSEDRAA